MLLCPDPFCVFDAEPPQFFRGEIGPLCLVHVVLQLQDHSLGIGMGINLNIYRNPGAIDGLPAGGTEPPLLVTIHVGEGPAPRAADDQIHAQARIVKGGLKTFFTRSFTFQNRERTKKLHPANHRYPDPGNSSRNGFFLSLTEALCSLRGTISHFDRRIGNWNYKYLSTDRFFVMG
jgi:hypothetical protein